MEPRLESRVRRWFQQEVAHALIEGDIARPEACVHAELQRCAEDQRETLSMTLETLTGDGSGGSWS